MRHDIVLSSRVRLARNYEDVPFDVSQRPEFAAICVARTVGALKAAGQDKGFQLYRLREMPAASRQAMAESRLISRDLLNNAESAAAMVRAEDAMTVMIGEDDHLRIQAIRPELDLLSAATACFRIDDALSRQVSFAFDEQLGYLTACPTNTGTGMRASLLMHLPLLTKGKQMGNVGQLVSKVGLNIRGVYGEGADALGNIYQISNQVTLGRTEQELIATVTALGNQLCDMESALRDKARNEGRIPLEDMILRSWGILTHARLMPLNEFYQHWSNLRLGAAMGLLKTPLALVDALLDRVQEAHLCVWAEESLSGQAMDEARAACIRELLAMS
ncbi:MAG: ATP--guanido phosphotransferase [Clostridia bacterium]|nr:ATP--guanido phosphotransferase [Clostridia bacterium]